MDSDSGITIDDCAEVSKHIEAKLDRDVEDFELNVTTYGIDQPLIKPRQFVKYLNKDIKLELEEGGKLRGTLLKVDDEGILLQPELPKSKNKLKKMSEAEKMARQVHFDEIKVAKCIISFK